MNIIEEASILKSNLDRFLSGQKVFKIEEIDSGGEFEYPQNIVRCSSKNLYHEVTHGLYYNFMGYERYQPTKLLWESIKSLLNKGFIMDEIIEVLKETTGTYRTWAPLMELAYMNNVPVTMWAGHSNKDDLFGDGLHSEIFSELAQILCSGNNKEIGAWYNFFPEVVKATIKTLEQAIQSASEK